MMIERVVNSFDKRLGWYVQEVWRYPEPEPKRGIAPDEHPAVKEDEWLAKQPEFRETYRRHGAMAEMIVDYLTEHGQASTAQMAKELSDGKPRPVDQVLRRRTDLFKIVDRLHVGRAKFAVWGLVK